MREDQARFHLNPLFTEGEMYRKAQALTREQTPALLASGVGGLDLLKRLHFLATEGSIHPDPLKEQVETDVEILIALRAPEHYFQKGGTIQQLHRQVEGLTRPHNNYHGVARLERYPTRRGEFRKIARVLPFDQEEQGSFDLYKNITIFLEDYDARYVPPNRKVDELMSQAYQVYEAQAQTQSLQELASALIQFYLTGLVIHPFIDGNTRAFQRFMEAECQRQGYRFEFPEYDHGGIIEGKTITNAPMAFLLTLLQSYSIPVFPSPMPPSSHEEVQQYYQDIHSTLADTLPTVRDNPDTLDIINIVANDLVRYIHT